MLDHEEPERWDSPVDPNRPRRSVLSAVLISLAIVVSVLIACFATCTALILRQDFR